MESSFKVWTSPDGLVGVEIDAEGCWLRTREHPADMWEAPIEMLPAGGLGKLTLSNAGISASTFTASDNQDEIDREIAKHEQAIFDGEAEGEIVGEHTEDIAYKLDGDD